jgi:ribosomal protein L11 methyltransferase
MTSVDEDRRDGGDTAGDCTENAAPGGFVEVTLKIPPDLMTSVAQCLFALGVGGLEERESEAGTNLVVFEPDEETASARLAALHERGYGADQGVRASLRVVASEDWRTRWLDDLRPERLTSRVVVVPEHCTLPSTLGDSHALIFGRELAFGYGEHASTRVAALAIAELLDELLTGRTEPGELTLLDVGSGTGVLGLVAACHGATSVLGVDLDAPSVRFANQNAERNQRSGVCRFMATPVETLDTTFDVVVANIERPVLLGLLPELRRRTKPGGALVIAGFLDSDAADLTRAGERLGLSITGTTEEDEWLALCFRAP